MTRRILRFLALLLVAIALTISFRFWVLSGAIAQNRPSLLVSAAISLKDVLEEIKPLYKPANLTYNLGASGALQQQIEQGAPVDVFLSAGKKQMDALESKGLLAPGTRANLATNKLVLIVPNDSKAGITGFSSLTNGNVKRIAVGEPRSVPAGQYAAQVFQNLGIAEKVKSKLVLANNVRQVLAAVTAGNADAGVVYLTDAKTTNKVTIVATASESSHSPIVYPIAVIKASKNLAAATDFTRFLSTNQAKAILRKYGFIVK
ncbi:MAG: molybdate ABC transporter substrate-binding protein [Verrucomicrobia bacterium]|nr:molybdate ABC transporter substrate-binding protein [Leptolyngbya sp. ES-bin-22]